MRHGRAKAARKTLKFYSINGNIKPPYKIILDGNFLAATVQQKVPLFDRMHKLLQSEEHRIYTTRSALEELNALPGDEFQEARRFGLDECEIIERRDIPSGGGGGGANNDIASNPKQDIKALTRNNNVEGWFVATQDQDLSDAIRGYVNVPQMRLTRAVLILEAPSSASRKYAQLEEKGKQMTGGGTMTHDERELIEKMKDADKKKVQQEEEQVVADLGQQRRKRKAKGPNPLSCKKKKNAADGPAVESKKRVRRRNKKEST
jgi:U3 small nucleolar RNA-associated protein 23